MIFRIDLNISYVFSYFVISALYKYMQLIEIFLQGSVGEGCVLARPGTRQQASVLLIPGLYCAQHAAAISNCHQPAAQPAVT